MSDQQQQQQQPTCQFEDRLSHALLQAGPRQDQSHATHSHDHDSPSNHSHSHQHGGGANRGEWTPDEHGHTHEHLEDAGKFSERDMPDFTGRDWKERAFTIGIGGPVGSGKTATLLALCKGLREEFKWVLGVPWDLARSLIVPTRV